MPLTNKVALVTGASSGIGAAVAQLYARGNARVVLTGRNVVRLNAVADHIRLRGGSVITVTGDISNSTDVRTIIGTVREKFNRLDMIVASAGISPSGSVTETSEDDWDRCMDTNLRSAFLLAKYGIPMMEQGGGGVIINVAGTFGLRGAVAKAAYCAAKAGVVNLTRAIALDHARSNIRCNVICPGFVDTPINDGFVGAPRDAFLDRHQPLPGVISADQVGALAVYLASDAAAMITGQTFVIDGGQQAGLYA